MNGLTVMKSLAYFDDADLEPDPVTLLDVSWEEIKLRMIQTVSDPLLLCQYCHPPFR